MLVVVFTVVVDDFATVLVPSLGVELAWLVVLLVLVLLVFTDVDDASTKHEIRNLVTEQT